MIAEKIKILAELTDELNRSTDDLNFAIERVSRELDAIGLSVFGLPFELIVNDKSYRIGFGKSGDKKQLIFSEMPDVISPLLTAPRIVRIRAMSRIDEILDLLIDEAREYVRDTNKARKVAENWKA